MWIESIFSSSLTVLAGWSLALGVGFALALLRFYLPHKIQNNFVFNLIIDLLKFPPPIAWIPFIIIMFGISFWSAVLAVVVGGMAPFFTCIYDIFCQTQEQYKNFSATLQLSKIKFIFYLAIPSQWQRVYTGARVSLGMSWMSIVASEMISSQSGLGYLIQLHRIDLNYKAIFIDIFLIAVCGYSMNQILLYIEKKHLTWKSL